MNCKNCGSLRPREIKTELVRYSDRTRQLKASCLLCGGFLRFLPQEIENFTMPFGKHKGLSFDEIYKKDLHYLLWMSREFLNKNIKKKVTEFLESKKQK